ncbi:BTAD domain-containing putative transcriptional regulator [Aggregatilinea lenta]|uniref:BTAD domain-containing putative transcriptional regulator n=1 Tax=Aggregatilinea lenta TaxID=913108 RepID=UPI0013C337EF|nr:BTAD domain-containing putative transcriptional regulator [Aggregatilinea lenta]
MTLDRERVSVDVHEFAGLLSGCSLHEHAVDDACDRCAARYHQAVDLYRGAFMAGFSLPDSLEFDEWQRAQRQWLSREYAGLHRRLSDHDAQAQHYERAIVHAQAWLAVDPLHEPAHRQLMRLLAVNGQRSEALRQYHQCVRLLDEELVSLPDDETNQLYHAIQHNRLPQRAEDPVAVVSPTAHVLPPLPALTVGRDRALRDIKHRLGIDGTAMHAVTVIQGWPGVGKSTILALLAHDADVARQFPDGILWASSGETPDISGAIAAWAKALNLGLPGSAPRTEDVSAQITAALRDKRALLIVDDIWQSEHAVPFRVGGQSCALVMTSRLNDVASALAPAAEDIYRLPVLTEPAGLELLRKLTPATVAEYPREARNLVRNLEGLPLAIHVAGRLLHTETIMGWGIKELLADLQTGSALLQAQVPSDMLGVGRETSPTIAALLRRSTDLLDAQTRQRFAYLGLFVPKPATFDLAAMAAAWNVADPKPTVRTLVNRGLLEPTSGGRFQMHALLVVHARALLEEEGNSL